LADVWDGHSGLLRGGTVWGDYFGIFETDDVDGDGVRDVWVLGQLLPGPLMGRVVDKPKMSDAIAWFADGSTDGRQPSQKVYAANVDIDRDGELDVLVGSGSSHTYDAYFGPFSGRIETFNSDPENSGRALIGSGCLDIYGFHFAPDLAGPGRHGILTGGPDIAGICSTYELAGWELDAQPFGYNSLPVLTVSAHADELIPTDDITQNGSRDLLRVSIGCANSVILEGPFADTSAPTPPDDAVANPPFTLVNGDLCWPVGDVNGDGQYDYVGVARTEDDLYATLQLSPFAQPLDVSRGVRLADFWTRYAGHPEFVSGDFDGDGLSDLVYKLAELDDDAIDHLLVYTGADLTAAAAHLDAHGVLP
jgi:hypothetical protein